MSTRWTPDLIQRMRDIAADGHTSKETASLLKAPWASVKIYAARNGIAFKPQAPKADDDADQIPPDAEAMAKAELHKQIVLAKREAATAPPYEGWRG
jgi:hypothetical protein